MRTDVEDDGIRMIENPGIPVIYSDGVADVEVEGEIVRITYFEYRTCLGKRVKSPVMEMIRPLKTCRTGLIGAMVARKLASHH